MRNRLFLAFVAVIITALASNIIFMNLSLRDFEAYVDGSREDLRYWILAAVEGSYENGAWNDRALHEALHWALMLGFDARVEDTGGREIANSRHVLHTLTGAMKRRMESLIDTDTMQGGFASYPLYVSGSEIGTIHIRDFERRGEIGRKEERFKKQGRRFMTLSFLIAGGGAVLLSIVLALFFSRPLKRMKAVVEKMAAGDLDARMEPGPNDEIGRLAGSFNYLAEALAREEALRRRLSSNIAHELRTPLAIMKANAEAAADGIIEDKAQALANIHAEIEKLIRLVDGIEDMIKAEASFFEKRKTDEIELSGFLGNLAAKLTPLALETGLRLVLENTGPCTVATDSDKLERIVQNLMTNAIRHAPGGSVTLSYGRKDETVFIAVSDTGSGIPAGEIRHIFTRFYRGEGSQGLGLGLAIVRELAEVLGGRIEVESSPGAGSTFTVWLPQARR
ncbi:MAG: ATP-binding protein [Thermodesulfovibrionales bacterium]